jgi:hypothetical protein
VTAELRLCSPNCASPELHLGSTLPFSAELRLCSALPFSLRFAQEGEFLVKLFFKKVALKRAELWTRGIVFSICLVGELITY